MLKLAYTSCLFLLIALVPSARASHVYAGITDTNSSGTLNAGDALSFVSNTAGTVVTGPSLGLQDMQLASFGLQSGLYVTSNISFTALAGTSLEWTGTGATATGAYRAKSDYSASAGSFIELRIDSITGPNGAKFSFWEEGATSPTTTFTIGTGVTLGSGQFNLTNPADVVGNGSTALPVNPNTGVAYSYASYAPTLNGLPAGFSWNDADGTGGSVVTQDPYGHIHGRFITVDTPGTYEVSYILHDDRGIQADSVPFKITYGAVPEPASLVMLGGGAALLCLLRRRRSSSAL